MDKLETAKQAAFKAHKLFGDVNGDWDGWDASLWRDGYNSGFSNAHIAHVESQGGWVSVKDRLPDERVYFIVTRLIGTQEIVCEAYFNGCGFEQTNGTPHEYDVIAWQPMLQQYIEPAGSEGK